MVSYLTSTEMDYSVPTELNITHLDDGRVSFTSTIKGSGKDNAQDPDALSYRQQARMVQLNYENQQCVWLRSAVDPV